MLRGLEYVSADAAEVLQDREHICHAWERAAVKPIDMLALEHDLRGAVSITDVDTDEQVGATQTNFVITGTGFGASQGAGSVTLRQGGNSKTLATDSWSATSIQADMSGAGMGVTGGLLYGPADIRVTENGAAFDDQVITVTAPSGTTSTTLSGGLAAPLFGEDQYGNHKRLFGGTAATDLAAASQVGHRNVQGSGGLIVNSDASLTIDSGVTAFDWDYTRATGAGGSHLYTGTVATWTINGTPPLFCGASLPNLIFAIGIPLAPINFGDCSGGPGFLAGDSAFSTFVWKDCGAAPSNLTLANGAGTTSTLLTLDSVAGLAKGDYIKVGSVGPGRVKYVDPISLQAGLWYPITWTDNAQVATVAIANATLPTGLTQSNSGTLSGTPTIVVSLTCAFLRATQADTQTADTP